MENYNTENYNTENYNTENNNLDVDHFDANNITAQHGQTSNVNDNDTDADNPSTHNTQSDAFMNKAIEAIVTTNTDLIFHNQLEVIYRVMMQRILKEVSAEELSFLIGRPANYVADVEMLRMEPYTADDLKYIAIALDSKEVAILSATLARDKKMKVTMEREFLDGTCVHSCVIYDNEGDGYTYYCLHEFRSGTDGTADQDHAYYTALVTDAISVLCNAGYFYEFRLPAKIYRTLNRFLKLTLNPILVREILDNSCNEAGKLTMVADEQNRLRYTEL